MVLFCRMGGKRLLRRWFRAPQRNTLWLSVKGFASGRTETAEVGRRRNSGETRMSRIRQVVSLTRHHHRRHREHCCRCALYPMRFQVPAGTTLLPVGSVAGVYNHFQRAQRRRDRAIRYGRSSADPTATGACRPRVICGMRCPANLPDGELPNTVLDLRQNINDAHRTLMRAQARNRCSVIQSRHGCSQPTEGCFLVTKNSHCPSNSLRQFLGIRLEHSRSRISATKQFGRNSAIPGPPHPFIGNAN